MELQLRILELQKENELLRLLQRGQEKRLQRYEGKGGDQLPNPHTSQLKALQKKLKEAQERGREAERCLKDSQEQLEKSQAAVRRLRSRKLADRGPREELRLQIETEKTNSLETHRKIKELELGCISHQRQLAAERKKTLSFQSVVRVQQDELKHLSNELKEKDCELETLKTIYGANRMPKQKKELAVLTAYNKLRLGLPSPALPNTPDVCFSLKELDEKKKNQLAWVGRRGRTKPTADVVFGSYSPSFGPPASRGHGLLSPAK